jgi:hypothetical protein
MSIGGYFKAQWPDATCTDPELDGDCTFDFYFTHDPAVTLVAMPRLEFRFFTADSGLSFFTGLGVGLSTAISGLGDDASFYLGYIAQLDVGVSVPVAPRWAAQFRVTVSIQEMDHESGPIDASPGLIQLPELSLGITYAF